MGLYSNFEYQARYKNLGSVGFGSNVTHQRTAYNIHAIIYFVTNVTSMK